MKKKLKIYSIVLRSSLENQFWFGKWNKLSCQCKGTLDQISKSFTKRMTWNCIHEYFNTQSYIIQKLKVHTKVFTHKEAIM